MWNPTARSDVKKAFLSRAAKRTTNGFRGLPKTALFAGLGMSPGCYRSQGRLWVRQPAFLPPHLLQSKGWPNAGGEHPCHCQPRWLGQRHGPTAVVVRGQEVLLFRPGHSVERLWTTQRANHEFLADVNELTSALPAPRLAARCQGRSLLTEWVEGESFGATEPLRRKAAIRQVLSAIARTSQRTAKPDSTGFVGQVIEFGRNGTAAAAFSRIATDSRLPALLDAPLTLQHGEPAGNNLLIRADGSPIIIDWDPGRVGVRPFWADAAHLASVDDYRPLMKGEFDHDLARLWRSVGLEPPAATELREIVAFGNVLFFAMIGLSARPDGRVVRLSERRAPQQISKPWKLVAAEKRLRSLSAE